MYINPLDSSDLKHWIDWQQAESEKTATGAVVRNWRPILGTYAKIEPVTTNARVLAAQVQHEISHRVTVRYDARLATLPGDWRGVYRGRYLYVSGPPRNVDEADIKLEIDCIEGLEDA